MRKLVALLIQCCTLATFPDGGASDPAVAQHSAAAGGGAGDNSSDASAGPLDASAVRTAGSGDDGRRALEETTSGAVQAWGANTYGQTGLPMVDQVQHPETVTQLGSDTVRIECGAQFCFGKKTSGSWVSWGRGAHGQLALGSNVDHGTPQSVPLLGTDTARIACQAHGCFGQKPSGAWVGWGCNTNGQLALGYNTDPGENAPVNVPLLSTDTVNLECTAEGCFGLKTSGVWVSWGVDSVGQLALGGPGNRNTPQTVTSLGSDVVLITCGPYHCLGRSASGDWLGWGWNNAGQLALGTDVPGEVWSAVAVPLLGTDTVHIVCGNCHCFGQKTSGQWISWGHAHMGQLLTGVDMGLLERTSPVAVTALGNDTAKVQCGANFCLEQKVDGQVMGWGANGNGELGAGFSSNYETSKQITSFLDGGLLYNYHTEDLYCGYYMCFGLQGPMLISDACYRDYSCVFCPAGEYDHDSNPSTVCLLCGAGNVTDTLEEAGATSCTPCPSGYFDHDGDSKTACVPCTTGAFATPTACEDCPRGTTDHDSSSGTPCEPCSPGFFADFGETSCQACEAGTADTDSNPATTCDSCAPGSFAPAGATSCSVCPEGYIDHDSDPATACDPADAGLCPAGTYAAEGSTECTNCTVGRADLDGTPLTPCTGCSAGYEQTATGQTACIPCAQGKADTDSNAESACDVCTAGMYAPEAGTTCYQCAAGEADVDNDPATSCEPCPPGTYSPEAATECGVCSAGTYDHDSISASQCVACTPGTFAAAGSTDCIDCASGRADLDFNPGTACTSCFEGNFSAAGSTECEACAPGRTDRDSNATTDCEACDRGQYNSEEGRAGECDDCIAGKFAPAAALTGCENCDLGQYAGNGSGRCVACVPGKADMDEDPSTPCAVCPNGTYASCGSRECAQCDQGKHDDDLSATTPCVGCTPGQYWAAGDPDPDNPDQADPDRAIPTVAACIDCPAGQVDGDRNSRTPCEPCAVGQFADAGSTRCATVEGTCTSECPQGTEDHDCNPSTACEACAPGQYSAGGFYPQDQCRPCAPGSYAAPGSHPAACEGCPTGQADNDDNQWTPCEPCRPGTFTADATNELVTSNATVCAECPPGRIDTDANASTSCSLCPVGRANPESRSVNVSACTPCEPGRWSYQEGMPACPDCQKGTYRGLEDLDGCEVCDLSLGTVCEAGSVYPRAGAGYFAELTTSESGTNTTNVMACVPFPYACLGTCTPSFRKSILEGTFVFRSSDDEGLLIYLDRSCDSGLETESCTDGYEGPRCSSCTKFRSDFDDSSCDEAAEPPIVNGYYRLESHCIPCPCTWIKFYHIMIALFVAAVLFMFCLELVTTDFAEHASTIAAPVFIIVSFCQTIATFLDTRMPWPAFLRRLMVIFSSLNFNLELTRPECAGDFGALQKVQFALVMPLFVGAAMAVYAFLTLIRIQYAGNATAEQRHSARSELRRKLASVLTTLFTVGAIFFTKSFLRAFDCVASKLDSNRKVMASAPEILCSSLTHTKIESLSTIGLISFAGCFVIIWLLLIQNHLSDNPGLGTFAFLAEKFEDHFFYWEMLIVLRKVFLMAIFLLFQPVPAVLLATFLTIFSLSIHIAARPYEDVGTDWTEMLSLCAQLITLVSGPVYIILNDPSSGMSSDSAKTFLTVLEIGGATVLATALGVGLLVELYVCRAVASNGNADEHDDFKIRTEQRALEDVKKALVEKETLVAKLIEAHDALRKEKEDVKAMHNHKQPASDQDSNPMYEEE